MPQGAPPRRGLVEVQVSIRSEVLSSISGRLTNEVMPEQCWFALERVQRVFRVFEDVRDPERRQRCLVIELVRALRSCSQCRGGEKDAW